MGEMAVKRVNDSEQIFETGNGRSKRVRIPKVVIWLVVAIGALGLYWYKTNTWPIVAVVNYKPITRYEINRSLFAKGGKAEVEARITEMQVEAELAKTGTAVSDDEVNAKIEEIKKGLGEGADIEAILSSRGMTLEAYKQQLKLLMGAEKAVSAKVTVTDQEVADYLKQGGGSATDAAQVATAREDLRLSKLDVEIGNWVKELQARAKVWKAPGI